MKKQVDKITRFAKEHYGLTLGVCCALVAAVVIIIAISVGNSGSDKWGKGITADIPLPKGLDAVSLNVTEKHAAAYFEYVSSDEVAEYIELVEDECNVSFESEKFPRSAVFEDKIIVVSYNVTEKKLSITVAAKGDNENVTSEDGRR